ncbi:MAG: hypothetical protein R3B07_23415 [Polyangiaceae bacterium]
MHSVRRRHPCEIDAGAGICLTGECVQTRCGDEYTDREAGEFCDDGQNGNDADGCTDDCQASCSKDTDCADQDLCNGEERCVNDVCVNGAAVVCSDSDPCTVDSCVSASGICSFQALDDGDSCGGGSICVGGSCSASRCGDGFVDASRGEECDDGKDGDDTDGCKDDCKFTCKTNADCTPTNRCQASTCNTTTHQCSAPTTITCDDQDACTVDSCNTATGCVFQLHRCRSRQVRAQHLQSRRQLRDEGRRLRRHQQQRLPWSNRVLHLEDSEGKLGLQLLKCG